MADKLLETLEFMKDETLRCIKNSTTHDAKVAWYYSQIGAYELAQQMGWITDAERQRYVDELCEQAQYPFE